MEDDAGNLILFGTQDTKDVALFDIVTHKVKLLSEQYPVLAKYNFSEVVNDNAHVLYMMVPGVDSIWIYATKKGLVSKPVKDFGSFRLIGFHNDRLYILSNDTVLIQADKDLHIINRRALPFKTKYYIYGPKNKGLLLRENYSFSSNRAAYLYFPDSIIMLDAHNLPPRDEKLTDFFFDPEIDGIIWRQGKLFDKSQRLIIDFAERGYKDLQHIPRAIYADGNNVMWAGTDFGLYKITINRNKFRNYFNTTVFAGNNSNSYRGIYLNANKLIANNEFTGACTYDLNTNVSGNINKSFDFGGFTCLLPDGNGNMLQGCFYGLNKISAAGKISTIKIGMQDLRVWALQPLGNDMFIAGTEQGLYYYNNRSDLFELYGNYRNCAELKDAFIIGITPVTGKPKSFWICSNKGLYVMNKDGNISGTIFSSQNKNHTPGMYEVLSVCEDGASIVWLGTGQGLIKWDKSNNAVQTYTRADGLSDNTIYNVIADDYGALWLSCNYGLMRFDKSTAQVKTFLLEDGISNNEFNRISAYVDSSAVYLGTLNGITSFKPAAFIADTATAQSPFVITAFYKFDHSTDKMVERTVDLLAGYSLVLEPDDKLFTIEYALLNYNYTTQNLYAYKFDGENDDWVYSKEHSLSFSRLPYGVHILHLKGKALNSGWSNEINIEITVIKPWYLQIWFFVLLVAIVALLFYAYVAFRTYNLRRTQQVLEAEVDRKTATIMQQADALKLSLRQKEILLQEIHHRVKNNLQVISGLLSLQGSSSGNAEVEAIMKEGRNRIKSMSLIHQMLYQNEDLQKLNFKEYLKQLLDNILAGSTKQGDVIVNIMAEGIWFDIDTAIPLGLIVTELATNAIKHAFKTGNGQISILVKRMEGDFYKLIFRDNGVGLPEGADIVNNKSLGLKLVKMLAMQLAAEIIFKKDDGQIIELTFNYNPKR